MGITRLPMELGLRGEGRVISNTNNDALFHVFNEVMLQGFQIVVSNLVTLSFNSAYILSPKYN
jgi:hypothetical protein